MVGPAKRRLRRGKMTSTQFAIRLRSYVDSEGAVDAVQAYCEPGQYTGAHFQTYGAGRSDPNRIGTEDLLAVTTLSVPISLRTQSGLQASHVVEFDGDHQHIEGLLRQLPVDVALHELAPCEIDGVLGEAGNGAAWTLFRYLRDEIGIPRVASYKLLARKRPHLLPVRDTVVEKALGHGRPTEWWTAWWRAFREDETLLPRLERIREASGVAPEVLSLLRVADVCIWMKSMQRTG